MSNYTNHMTDDQALYRGVLQYDFQPKEWVIDPAGGLDYYGHPKKINVACGPVMVKTDIIGPYSSTTPIKSYVTRHRNRKTNLRVVRFEKTTGWEEVEI